MVGTLVNKPNNGPNTSRANTVSYQKALPWEKTTSSVDQTQKHLKHTLSSTSTNTIMPETFCSSPDHLPRKARAASAAQGSLSAGHRMQPSLILRDSGRFAHLAPLLSQNPAPLHRHNAAIRPHVPILALKTACAEVPRININPYVMAKKKSTKNFKDFMKKIMSLLS